MSGEESTGLKSAASLLLKGGTLVSEPCEKCGGVQVRFGGKTTCIGCGNSTEPSQTPSKDVKLSSLDSAVAIIEDKITTLAEELKGEKDTLIQKQKLDLIESCVRILEKMKAPPRQA